MEEEASEEDIEEKLGYSTEDVEDNGGAEDTESFEVDEVELPFEMVRLVDFSVTSMTSTPEFDEIEVSFDMVCLVEDFSVTSMTSIGGCSFVGLI